MSKKEVVLGASDRVNIRCLVHIKPRSQIFFPIVHDRDKFSNCKQSETNRSDENAMCDYFSEYLQMCIRLHDNSSRPFPYVLWTFCERSRWLRINKKKWEQFPRNAQIVQTILQMIPISLGQKRLPCRLFSDCSLLLICLYRY